MKPIATLALALLVAVAVGLALRPDAQAQEEPTTVGAASNLEVSATGQPAGTVRVSWDAADNAQVHFVVYIKSSDAATGSYAGVQMASFSGADGVISGLEPGTEYQFIVIGMRWNWVNYGAFWGAWSDWAPATTSGTAGSPTGAAPSPVEPQQVTQVSRLSARAASQSTGAVRVSWKPADNAQAYFVVYVKAAEVDAGNYAGAQMAAFNGTDGVISGLEPGTPYRFTVIGMRWNWVNYGLVWGRWTPWAEATPSGSRPAPTIAQPPALPPANGPTTPATSPEPTLSPAALRDRDALLAIKRMATSTPDMMATSTPAWMANWNEDTPMSEWTGVFDETRRPPNRGPCRTAGEGRYCTTDGEGNLDGGWVFVGLNENSRVTELVFLRDPRTSGSPPLAGRLLPHLLQLTELKTIYITGHDIAGPIPPGLGQLTKLEYLLLTHSNLSGAIPKELGSPAALQWLYLNNNELSGAIPPELGNLGNLAVLSLADNRLTGAIPKELSSLHNLTLADLDGNLLTGCMPATLADVHPAPSEREAAARTPHRPLPPRCP